MPTRDTRNAFTVAGTGAFPFDMLRYDECWPAHPEDVRTMAMETRDVRARDSRRAVRLVTNRALGPTIRRWESFGWKVISHDSVLGAPLHPDDAAAARAEFEAERKVS